MTQKTRKVTLYSVSDDNKQEIFTKATTWGELLDTCPIAKKVLDGKSAVIRGETNSTVEHRDHNLPQEEFVVMFHVKKVSAGSSSTSFAIACKRIEERDMKHHTKLIDNIYENLQFGGDDKSDQATKSTEPTSL